MWETESLSHILIKKRTDPHVPQRAQDTGEMAHQAIDNRPRDALISCLRLDHCNDFLLEV